MKRSYCVTVIVGVALVSFLTVGAGAKVAATRTTLYLPAISSPPLPTATPDPVAQLELRISELINEARAQEELPPLTWSSELARAARRHSADMAYHRFFEHIGSDGSTPGRRIEAAGYAWNAYGEVIAAGHTTAESVVAAWMESACHRTAILSTSYRDLGVGYAYGASAAYRHYYTVNLAAR